MDKIINSIIHDVEGEAYAISFSDKVSAGTLEKVLSILIKEEVLLEKVRNEEGGDPRQGWEGGNEQG